LITDAFYMLQARRRKFSQLQALNIPSQIENCM